MGSLLRSQFEPQSTSTIIAGLYTTAVLAFLVTPSQHSLLVHSLSWTILGIACSLRTGTKVLFDDRPGKAVSYVAGLLFAVTQICERAVKTRNLWWTQALLPLCLYAVAYAIPVDDTEKEHGLRYKGTWSTLAILTLCAVVASYQSTGSDALVALSLAYLVVSVVSLLVIERALKEARHTSVRSTSLLLSLPTQPTERQDVVVVVLQDMSIVAGAVCLVIAIAWEAWRFDGLTQFGLAGQILGDYWIPGQFVLSVLQAVVAVIVQVVCIVALALTVCAEKSLTTSFVLLGSATTATILACFSFGRLWFACISAAFLFITHTDSELSFATFRPLRALTVLAAISIIFLLRHEYQHLHVQPGFVYNPIHHTSSEPSAPVQLVDQSVHPIAQLIHDSRAAWARKVSDQSQTLEAAVAEYRRRYGMNPPPNFDKWFEFAKTRNVKLIDEYDTVYQSLLPFWALSPATIRSRTREAFGFRENNLVGLLIRDGQAVHVENGDDWQQRATIGMMEHFIQYLPDMDLAFNVHDEPRVVVPSDALGNLVSIALGEIAAASGSRNAFSSRPQDMNAGQRIDEVKLTRFNHYPHQPTWGPSKISCPAETPVGSFREAVDNLTSYALGDLGFIYNHTAFSDICNSPSLETSHGFFERPNAFNVVHDLFPIFSQSKMSSFQDILYPSPWYWYGKVEYREMMDKKWENKQSTLWWRGSTTGGFSRDGGWRRQHRQHFVKKVNAHNQALIMAHDGNTWAKAERSRTDFKDLVDVKFSHVGQCDDGDCAAQREFFDIAPPADQQDAWDYRYLLDLDGNAFSGRFYAFLRSHSLTFKMAVFREWHEEWIKPWVHYIPLSLLGEDVLEAVRYIDVEPEGQEEGTVMAETSRAWAEDVLRNDDFETWFFRLLLEYGRLVDDNRSAIGYA